MELRHLRYFRVVAEEGHITRAAERLSIQQPPLSLQIKALETELGVQLFRRLPRGVELTDAGASFYGDICAVLDDVAHATARARRIARGEAGEIAIGFTSSAIAHRATKSAIQAFRARFPEVSLTLEEDGSFELVGAIAENRLDAAFIRTSAPGSAGIRVIQLVEEPMVLASPEGGPLSREDGPVELARIADHPIVLYRRSAGPGLYDRIIAGFERCGLTPRVIQEAPRVGSTLNLVAAGMGATLVPASLCAAHAEGVHYRPVKSDPPLTASISLACRKTEASQSVKFFIQTVRETMRSGDGA